MIFIEIKNRHKRYVTCDDVVEMAVIETASEAGLPRALRV